jgi:O-methyltransferase
VTLEGRYLELTKQALSYSLWPEPLVRPQDDPEHRGPVDWFTTFVDRLAALKKLHVARQKRFTEKDRLEGQGWPLYADTMIGRIRLDNIQACIETVLRDGVEGDLIETGVWRGGAAIFMRAVLAAYGVTNRKVFVADSFEGLPVPEPQKYPVDGWYEFHTYPYLAVTQEQVAKNFARYGLLDDQVVFLKGWFKDSLPNAPIDKLAVMRLDGDMYVSTIDALTPLYPKLSDGGFCIIDDYAIEGCKRAVNDYRAANGIDEPLQTIDWTGQFWRKGEQEPKSGR